MGKDDNLEGQLRQSRLRALSTIVWLLLMFRVCIILTTTADAIYMSCSSHCKRRSIASSNSSKEKGFSKNISAPFSRAISRTDGKPEIIIILIDGYFFLR